MRLQHSLLVAFHYKPEADHRLSLGDLYRKKWVRLVCSSLEVAVEQRRKSEMLPWEIYHLTCCSACHTVVQKLLAVRKLWLALCFSRFFFYSPPYSISLLFSVSLRRSLSLSLSHTPMDRKYTLTEAAPKPYLFSISVKTDLVFRFFLKFSWAQTSCKADNDWVELLLTFGEQHSPGLNSVCLCNDSSNITTLVTARCMSTEGGGALLYHQETGQNHSCWAAQIASA